MARFNRQSAIHRRAFTLIEVLVVIAIIAIVMAIVFPVFAAVREKGRAQTCMNNLSQLGKAFQLYTQDYDGYLPRAFSIVSRGRGVWVAVSPPCTFSLFLPSGCRYMPEEGTLYPYVKNPAVYVCPSDPLGSQTRLTYRMNVRLGVDIIVVHESEITKPSQTVLLVEKSYDPISDAPGFRGDVDPLFADVALPCHFDDERCVNLPTGEVRCLEHVSCYHNGATNVLFVDGHVKLFPRDTLKSGYFLINQ